MIYHRYCSDAISPFTGERYGIFVAVWHLIRDRKVTEEEEAEYWQHRTWFEENLPVPPFYSEGNPRRAVTWFKDCAMSNPTLARLSFYRDLAARYQLEIGLESTGEPGEIIYEDDFQVAAIRKEIAELQDASDRGHHSSLNSGFDSRGS